MKKFILLSFCLLCKQGFAQYEVVSAPFTDEILTEQAAQSKANFGKEMEEVKKQSKFYTDTKNALVTVKSQISQGRKAIRAVTKSVELYDLIIISVRELKGSNYPSKITQKPLLLLGYILEDIEDTGEELTNVLSNNVFRMTDAERMNFIDKLNIRLDEIKYKILSAMRSAHRYGRLYRSYTKN